MIVKIKPKSMGWNEKYNIQLQNRSIINTHKLLLIENEAT